MDRKDIWPTLRSTPKQTWLKAFRFGCILLVFELLTLAAGIGIWMIFHGLWIAGLRLVAYWKPARSWFANILKLQGEQYVQLPPITWFRWFSIFMFFLPAAAFIFFGTLILIQNGFLGQNIIYWFFGK